MASSTHHQTSFLPETWAHETDVLVAGASLGGLAAALRAIQQGMRVILIEASKETGGTALISGGVIHTNNLTTWDEFEQKMPTLDPALGRVFADTWPEASAWVMGLGVPLQKGAYGNGPSKGADYTMGNAAPVNKRVPNYKDKRAYCDGFDDLIGSGGGIILKHTRAVKLWQGGITGQEVVGLRAVNPDGDFVDIKAKATILAVGGFQNNKELRVRYLGEWADLAVCLSSPYNTGAGLLMGVEVGAMLSRSMAKGYGQLQPHHINIPKTTKEFEDADLTLVRQLISSLHGFESLGICVNLDGKRVFDEGYSDSNVRAYAFLKQPYARVFLIFDSTLVTTNEIGLLDLIKMNGGVVVTDNKLEGLIEKLGTQFGIRKRDLAITIQEYSRAISNGPDAASALEVERTGELNSIVKPPFYCVPATCGLTMQYGGLAIDTECRVLNTAEHPIAGLYAIPGTAGGIYYEGYIGSLAELTTFGYIAGKTVAEDILKNEHLAKKGRVSPIGF